MLLSILTPSRNYARFLPDALRSVAAQHDGEVEHIVVDGASTDGTLKVLHEWSDYIRFVSEPDKGQSDALNKAVAMAKGEWLGWLNADEFYLPGAFDAVRTALQQWADSDVIYGDCCLIDVAGRLIRLFPQHPFHPRTLRWYGPIMTSSAVFIRASALPERGWDTSLRRMMDWDLYLELSRRRSRFVHLAVPLAAFRIHGAQVTAHQVPNWAGEAQRVRIRHGLTLNPRSARALRAAGRLEHGVRKLAVGAYQRQARVRVRLRGSDLRWFASPDAESNAKQLLATVSASA
jgi:glycosyltransferase involved in cell wall biosynthesis